MLSTLEVAAPNTKADFTYVIEEGNNIVRDVHIELKRSRMLKAKHRSLQDAILEVEQCHNNGSKVALS